MTRFPTAGHLASWAGVCPGHHESAGKRKSGKTRHGDRWLTGALGTAALDAARTRDGTYLGAKYCSEQPAPPGTTSSSAGSALQVVSPPTARASDAVAPQCQTSDLAAGRGPENAAAGTVAFPIVLTNNGSGPCVLEGFPGVSYATGPDSAPVGAPAARDGASSGPVELAPGGQASALVYAITVHNIPPPEQCQPVSVPGLRIYPPDNTVSLYLERAGTACSLAQATTTQLRIHAVVAGTSGR